MPPKAKGAKKKGGYQMPEEFDECFVLRDIYKKPWTLGKPIGKGGFGLIYLAERGESPIKNANNAEFVVKIEPKDNGPLFCETHFYVNSAKEDDLKNFIRVKGLKHLAMPRYVSSGTCTYKEKDYRFLVMDRFTSDLQSILNKTEENRLSEVAVLSLMRQVLLALEYIHQRGYAHGDIKGANLMLKNDHEAYLVDFGLAVRFMRDDVHQKYEIKPERRHNGTIEYTSRDAHDGAQINRRSDLEILGYCVIHWLCGTLPWIGLIKNNEQVQQSKVKNMKNVKEFVKTTLGSMDDISECVMSFVEFYLNEVNKLQFDSEPDYSKIQTKLNETLKLLGHSNTLVDNFCIFNPVKKSNALSKKNVVKKEAASSLVEEDLSSEVKAGEAEAAGGRRRRPAKVYVDDTEEEEEDEESRNKRAKPAISLPTKAKTSKKKQVIDSDVEENSENILEEKKKGARSAARSRLVENDSVEPKSTPRKRQAEPKTPIGTKNRQPLKEPQHDRSSSPRKGKSSEEIEVSPEIAPRKAIGTMLNEKSNGAIDLVSRFKASMNNSGSAPPRSPLALAAVESAGPMLVKRHRNVPSCTVSTQTDKSYLLSLRSQK